ncbi:MAG: hypothetical protein HRU15_12560, partial [Planctomycetes bacterium]|nr:hypothetical protein [Planctomycetota bacterium]
MNLRKFHMPVGSTTLLLAALALPTMVAPPQLAAASVEDQFRSVSLQAIMGNRWRSFQSIFGALMFDPKDEKAMQELVVTVSQAGALNKIAPYVKQMANANKSNLNLQLILALVYKDALKDLSASEHYFKEILKTDAKHYFSNYQLALIYQLKGKKHYKKSEENFIQALNNTPVELVDMRAKIQSAKGELYFLWSTSEPKYQAKAFNAWDTMTTGNQEYDLQSYQLCAGIYRSHAIWNKVVSTYEKYFTTVEARNDKVDNLVACELYIAIGEAYQKSGEYDKAI